MALEADDGLTLTAYAAPPNTASRDGLEVLASRAATTDETELTTEARRYPSAGESST